MPNFLRIPIAFILTIILSVILTPFVGGLYDHFFAVSGGFFWGPPHPEYIEGFIVAYMFSLPLFFFSLLEKKKITWSLIGISPFVVFILWGRFGDLLIMGGIALIIGASLGMLASKLSRTGEKN